LGDYADGFLIFPATIGLGIHGLPERKGIIIENTGTFCFTLGKVTIIVFVHVKGTDRVVSIESNAILMNQTDFELTLHLEDQGF
jgi:hypothetical protein